jgi:hypothetical protein
VDAVHPAQQARRPRAARLCEDETQLREALEHGAEDQLAIAALHEERHLEHPHHLAAGRFAVARAALTRVLIDHQAVILDRRPQAVVVRRVELREVDVVERGQRQQHAAAQPVLGDPFHVRDCVVEVVQVDQPDARAATGLLGAEVGEPAVVSLDALPAEAVFLLRPRRQRGDDARRVEGWDRVREHDLSRDAFGVHVPNTGVALPAVARHERRAAHHQLAVVGVVHRVRVVEVGPRVVEVGCPRVELVVQRRGQVRLVAEQVGAGMGVGGDEHVGT